MVGKRDWEEMAGARRRGHGTSDGDEQPKPRQWPVVSLGPGE